MNILVLLDKTAHKLNFGQVTREVGEIYKKNCDIDIKWFIEDFDYTSYPIQQYWGGYYGMNQNWLREQCATIYKRYAEEIDCVVFAPTSTNWTLDREDIVGANKVWGWNMSALFSGYGVQQIRVAQLSNASTANNIANTLGTLYHEVHHDADTFVFNYTGEVVETMANVQSWDNGITHGGEAPWQYIRHKENQRSLELIAPALKKAIANRRALFEEKVGAMQTIIQLANQYIVLLRAKLAEQRGDIAILPDNKCSHVTQN